MKRKDYQKPTMKVVTLRQQCNILAGSNRSSASMSVTYEEEEWIEN